MRKFRSLFFIMLVITMMMGNTETVKADTDYSGAKPSKTVTTQKQLKEALKDENIGTIIIKPKKKTTFDFNGIETSKDIHIHLSKATVKNLDKADTGWITLIVSNQKELDKAVGMSNIVKIRVETDNKEKFVLKEHASSNVIINTPNSSWTLNDTAWHVEIENLKNGTRTDNAGNKIGIEGDVKKVTVGPKAVDTVIQIYQEPVSKSVSINVKGKLKTLEMYSTTPVKITFSENTTTDYVFINNYTEEKFNLTVNGNKQKVGSGFLNTEGKVLSYEELIADYNAKNGNR